ncbi:phage virion morphogenesis protein [Pararoseomonas sp. SCSIO 73927]|uniref:phage virion morphogenesis protein n=1 Tax=Pararoseomonas sp. SCSIO 73927 TaxID=3114537 RepID=UPI0030CAC9E3
MSGMVGVHIDIQGDKEVLKVLQLLMAAGTDPGPFLRPLGTQLLRTTRERAADEVDPEGKAWEPLSEEYAKRKVRPTMLREKGILLGGLTREVEGFDLSLGTNEVYAAIHQFGGETGPAGTSSIPAREYLGLSADDILMIQEEWEDFATRRGLGR